MGRSHNSSRRLPSAFVVGLDPEGHWIAVETHGRGGGFFASREAALRYATFETGHRPHAVRVSRQPVRFKWSGLAS